MQHLYDYICEDVYVGSSDNSIYKRLAVRRWNYLKTDRRRVAKKNYPGIPEDSAALIKWFKETYGKIPSNKEEIIPRKDWNLLQHVGEVESSLMSPHKWTYFDYICKNTRPENKKNKVLVVLNCSSSKPYCQDHSKLWYFRRFRSFCDFSCGAFGIVPEEYSMLYPIRYDEWDENKHSESAILKSNVVDTNRGYDYIMSQGYDHIISLFQGEGDEEFMHWMTKMPNMEGKIHFVVNKDLKDKVLKSHPIFKKHRGLMQSRLLNMPEVHESFLNILSKCLEGEDLKRFKELRKLLDAEEDAEVEKWCEKTNEEFNIQPYSTSMAGFKRNLKKSEITFHTETSDLEDSIINEYCEWIKGWAKKQNAKKMDENTDWYKERLIFTPLDLLIQKYDLGFEKPYKKDIDKLYWNMFAAIKKVAKDIGVEQLKIDKYEKFTYLWIFASTFEHMDREDFIKYSDKVGLSQYDLDVLHS